MTICMAVAIAAPMEREDNAISPSEIPVEKRVATPADPATNGDDVAIGGVL